MKDKERFSPSLSRPAAGDESAALATQIFLIFCGRSPKRVGRKKYPEGHELERDSRQRGFSYLCQGDATSIAS